MTPAIIFAFASAVFLGAGVVLAQLGLRTVEPLSGAAIYPPVTVALSAMLLKHIEITARIVAGAALTVMGVALVLVG